MSKLFLTLIWLIGLLVLPSQSLAASTSCANRYLTLVNPVRDRSLWVNPSTSNFNSQYSLIHKYDLSGTWLLQYDALKDQALLSVVRQMDKKQELGILLEVSKGLADDSGVIYPINTPWYKPNAVFLSGYSQSDRRALIDKMFLKFKSIFGYYPKSVGAWWIDSYSLNYLKAKYGITSAMIVADQKTTDNYGVWGQWWGVPYYPSKANILTPASSLSNKQAVVIIQWAQRDPILATGSGSLFSNYSLQANDYIRQGKDTNFFKQLVNLYLDCKNPVGQITVGLETGIEGAEYQDEYQNQLSYLASLKNLQSVTMDQFAQKFASVYPGIINQSNLDYQGYEWQMTPDKRMDNFNQETIEYNPDLSFDDYFVPDKQQFLNRTLPLSNNQKNTSSNWWLLVGSFILVGLIFLKIKQLNVFIIGLVFSAAAFGLILKSFYRFGWQVFFGPVVPGLDLVKAGLFIGSVILILLISKLKLFSKANYWYLWFIPLSFGMDEIIQSVRSTYLSGRYYLGVLLPHFQFLGLSFQKLHSLSFSDILLPSYQAAALLRIDFSKIWGNLFLSLAIYPLIHIGIGLLMGFFFIHFKISKKITISIFIILAVLLIWHFYAILMADPRIALPIT